MEERYTKSDPIDPFWVLVVETFRRNVSTKFCGLPKKGVADADSVFFPLPMRGGEIEGLTQSLYL